MLCQCEFGEGEGMFKAEIKILYAVLDDAFSPFSAVGKIKLTGESGHRGLFSRFVLSGKWYPFL